MKKPPLILALGEILWDLLPAGKQLGGAPANFAFHAAQLGARAAIISAVGDDELGREIFTQLRGLDVPLMLDGIAIDRARPTGTVSVALEAGQPTYTIHENVAWDFIPATPHALELARQADCICFGTLAQRGAVSRQTIHSILAAAREACLIVFDVNLRQNYFNRDVVRQSMRSVNVLKLNTDEIDPVERMLGPLTVFDARYPRLHLTAITRGENGSILIKGIWRQHAGYKPDRVADTIGAGDAFTAALAMGLLAKLPLDRIHDNANRLASFVCTQSGAMAKLPVDLLAQLGAQ
jgi:fructokinase